MADGMVESEKDINEYKTFDTLRQRNMISSATVNLA